MRAPKLIVGAVASTIIAGSALLSAPPAQALPSNCHFTISNRDVIGTCDQGTGKFRIHLDCRFAPDQYSIWAPAGQMVSVKCPMGKPYRITWEME